MSDEEIKDVDKKTPEELQEEAIAKLEAMDDDDFEKAIEQPTAKAEEEEEQEGEDENQNDDDNTQNTEEVIDENTDDQEGTDDQDESTKATEDEESDDETDDENKVEVTDDELIALADDIKLPKQDLAKLFQPINAAGSKVQLSDVDEIITLIQKGVDYQNKSTALAKDRKYVKMLKDNDLLDTEKLSFLIDLNKKDPGAIAKLVKESEIDTFELDDQEEYQVNDYTPDMQQVAVGDVLESLKGSTTYDTLMTELQELDETSAQHLYEKPESLPIINKQIELGIYDTVKAEVTKRRMLGQIPTNVPFIQAYFAVGQEMEQSNRFATQNPPANTPAQKAPTNDKELDTKRNQFSPARKSSKSSKQTKQPSIEDLDSLSDEDFKKRYSIS